MPHVDISMIPGRDDTEKKEIVLKLQAFLAKELEIDDKFVSVSIEDVPKEEWESHMQGMQDKVRFV